MKNLQIIRKRNNLTQEEVASFLNISQQAYANYEKEDVTIPSKISNALSKLFKCNIEEFYYMDELENDSINEFLYKSLTPYHVVKNCESILLKNGFIKLNEHENWEINKGGKYYIKKNNSAFIAFIVGSLEEYSFNIVSSHTDSPCLKIKGNSLIDSIQGKRINVEKYGGLINYSFFDIPLKIAGRIITKDGNELSENIYTSPFNVSIPSLCIHHNPNVNSNFDTNISNDMLPIIGNAKDLYSVISSNTILDSDLYCIPFVKPTYSGINNEYLLSPRIDNLTSVYASINSIINIKNNKNISLIYATDNEEIGSLSKQGAHSSFLLNVLKRINIALGKNEEKLYSALSNSFLLSVDNAHATHPAHMNKMDNQFIIKMNNGVVIKHHPNYSTDSISSSIIKQLANEINIPIQDYYNHSDLRCGSTIGLLTSAQLAINACDIGLPQLAMHSGVETIGVYDIEYLIKLLTKYFNTALNFIDKKIILK